MNWKKAPKQLELLMGYTHLSNLQETRYKEILVICWKNEVYEAALNALIKKNIFLQTKKETGRLAEVVTENIAFDLTPTQDAALNACRQQFKEKNVALLYGVTGKQTCTSG